MKGWTTDRAMVEALITWGAMIVPFEHERLALGTQNGFFEAFSANGRPAYRLTEKGRVLAREHGIVPKIRTVAKVMASEAPRNPVQEAFTRACPQCRSPVGEHCRSPNGRLVVGVHNARRA